MEPLEIEELDVPLADVAITDLQEDPPCHGSTPVAYGSSTSVCPSGGDQQHISLAAIANKFDRLEQKLDAAKEVEVPMPTVKPTDWALNWQHRSRQLKRHPCPIKDDEPVANPSQRVLRRPRIHTQAEWNAHMPFHIPVQNLCPECAAGAGIGSAWLGPTPGPLDHPAV